MHEKQLDLFCRKAKKIIKKENPIILEIGARDCRETVGFLEYFPNARIFSFECNPETLPICRENVSKYKNITLIEKAVTLKDGQIDFYQIDTEKTETIHPDGNPGASSVLEANPIYEPEKYIQKKITVDSVTLKTFMTENHIERVDILWMDIQGAELDALKSAGKLISNILSIHSEVEFFPIYKNQPMYKEIRHFLKSNGFGLKSFTSIGRYAGDAFFMKNSLIKSIIPESFKNAYFMFLQKIISSLPTKSGVKRFLRKHYVLSMPILQIYFFIANFKKIFSERRELKEYKNSIREIINSKKIVLDISHKGLGDWLSFSSLPRLLKEKYDVDFYLYDKSVKRLNNRDIFKFVYESNPYFKGILNDKPFRFKIFAVEKNPWHFISDRNSPAITEIVEKQFGLDGKGVPEIFYTPKILPDYKNTILVDKNYISGKKVGWVYNDKTFKRQIAEYSDSQSKIEYIDPMKQNIWEYTDMIFSSKRFITVLSGGAVIAACFDKPFTVILPFNAFGESVDQFVFSNSSGKYVR